MSYRSRPTWWPCCGRGRSEPHTAGGPAARGAGAAFAAPSALLGALAILQLSIALGAGTAYWHGGYFTWVEQPALTTDVNVRGTLNVLLDTPLPIQAEFRIAGTEIGEPEQDMLFERCRIDGIEAWDAPSGRTTTRRLSWKAPTSCPLS